MAGDVTSQLVEVASESAETRGDVSSQVVELAASAGTTRGDVVSILVEVAFAAGAIPIPTLPAREAVPEARWLLDLDLGGAPIRLSTSEGVVPSRADGGEGRLYVRGLPPLEVPLSADSLSVTVPVDDLYGRARQVRQLVGRGFTLRLYRDEPVLEDALTVLQGVVAGVRFGDPAAPGSASLDLRRSALVGSTTMLRGGWVVDHNTWLDVARVAPPVLGAAYPLVIGRPGREEGTDDETYPATPALMIDRTSGDRVLLVAVGKVEAAKVWIHDLSDDGGAPEERTVATGTDDVGQVVSTTALLGVTREPKDYSRVYVGWSARSGYGGGTLFEGRPITGLGTLLLWGSREYGRDPIDVGMMRSVRDQLDEFQIDACVNDPACGWDDWVASNLLEVYGLERIDGPRGTWFRPGVYRTHAARVRATLVTSRSDAGHLVRLGGYGESLDDLCSEITVQFAPYAASGSAYKRQVTLGSERRLVVINGIISSSTRFDPRTQASPLCRRSVEVLGRKVARTWMCGTTAHTPTAWAIARRLAERYALPSRVVDLEGGPLLAELQPFDTVELRDHLAPGPVLGIVQPGIVLSERAVRLTVRIPTT